MKMIKHLILTVLIVSFWSCNQQSTSEPNLVQEDTTEKTDPLPSWNDGATKQAIMDFVTKVSTEGSPDFVAIEDRIATFDNDGNLWAEQPAYFQLFFAMDRIKAMAADHPEWANEQPYKAVLENDMKTLASQGEHGLLEIVMATHGNLTTDEFESIVKNWLSTARHPRFDKPYNEMIYQPMLELLQYLREHDFKTFIVSGGGVEFMRPWVGKAYGIPPDQVVGSSVKTEFDYNNGNPVIRRLPEIDFIDDKAGKPVGINKFIGKKPIFASGNSDGDLQMLQYTASNNKPSFMLYLHHTDAEREWAYDRDSHIGRLDKGLDEAAANGWTVIDMKNDWNRIFPFE